MDNNLFNSLQENLILVNEDLKIYFATDKALQLLSVDRASVNGKSLSDITSDFNWNKLSQIKEGEQEKFILAIHNKSCELTVHCFKYSNELIFQCSFLPMENLRLSKHEISNAILNTFPGIVTLYNCKTGGLAYINESIEELTGIHREEFIEKGISLIFTLIHPEDAPGIIEKNFKEIAKANSEYPQYDEDSIISFDYRMKSGDGNYKWVHSFGLIYQRDDLNQVEYILNFTFDITERKEKELKVQQSEHELYVERNRLQQKIQEGKEELHSIERYYLFTAESIPGIFWTALPNGEMDYYSASWEEYTGIKREDALNGEWVSVFHPEDVAQCMELVQTALVTGTEYKMEHRIKSKDGSYRWFKLRAFPLLDNNGKVVKWFGTSFDIDEEKKLINLLQENEVKYKFLADSIPQIIWTADKNGKTDYLNKKWYEYTGMLPNSIDLNTNPQHIHPNDLEMSKKIFRDSIIHEKSFSHEFRLRKYDGEYRWFLCNGTPMKDHEGNVVRWFGTSTDIQYQKEIIDNLATTQQGLNIINQELNKKNEELNKINIDLDNFIYTASHDLKSPISNIEGLINFLKKDEQYYKGNTKEILDLMIEATERFKKTIGGLTVVAKIQKSDMDDIEEVTFKDVLDDILKDLPEIKSSGANITTDFTQQVRLKFSKKNMRSILYNLTSNALKYRSPNRPPKIEIKTTKDSNYTLLIVKDNGLGFPQNSHDSVFKMFKRLHTHVEGTGIGLYIVKRIIDNAGGKIEIESEVNEGTTFKIYFPE